MNLNCRFYYP